MNKIRIILVLFVMLTMFTGYYVSAQDLKIQYQCAAASNIVQIITSNFIIYNNGDSSVNLSSLTVRYYRTNEGGDEIALIYWASIGNSQVSTRITADYIEYSFSMNAGSIPGGGNSGGINSGIHHTNWSDADQTNDYSFDGTKTDFTDWDKMTLYYNGNLIWGTEPDGRGKTPVPASD